MADDVLLNKAAAIERAVRRVREEHAGDDRNLFENQTRQDAIILNLQRACETSIDAAMHLVRIRRLGVPQDTRDAFVLLEDAQIVDPAPAPLSARTVRQVRPRGEHARDDEMTAGHARRRGRNAGPRRSDREIGPEPIWQAARFL
jgi:uncharacterized protein YutE (UPF0331/DUF86 family)